MSTCKVCNTNLFGVKIVRGEYCRPCYYASRKNGSLLLIEKKPLPMNLSSIQDEYIIGSILGDGSLMVHKNGINPIFEIGRSIKDKEYLLYEYSLFEEFCTEKAIYNKQFADKRSGTISNIIGFRTRCTPALLSYYKKWYCNGKKIVSNDLKLSSTIIGIWLADDGCIGIQPHSKSFRLKMNLATNSFTKEETIFLITLLNDRYNESFRMVKRNNQHMIEAADSATRSLLKDIDACFPENMERKSSIWRDDKVRLYDPNYKLYKPRLPKISK